MLQICLTTVATFKKNHEVILFNSHIRTPVVRGDEAIFVIWYLQISGPETGSQPIPLGNLSLMGGHASHSSLDRWSLYLT